MFGVVPGDLGKRMDRLREGGLDRDEIQKLDDAVKLAIDEQDHHIAEILRRDRKERGREGPHLIARETRRTLGRWKQETQRALGGAARREGAQAPGAFPSAFVVEARKCLAPAQFAETEARASASVRNALKHYGAPA